MVIFSFRKNMLLSVVPLVIIFLSLCSLTLYRITYCTGLLEGKTIVVDAGHGGVDSGAFRQGIAEKDINLNIAIEVKKSLASLGARVILSRDKDVELSKECDDDKVKGRYRRDLMARLEYVEENQADLFVSIHANASYNSSRNGTETFYYHKSETGKKLAECIQKEMNQVTSLSIKAAPGDYFLLRRNTTAAALIEVGYISNAEERKKLLDKSYQAKLANAIAMGIVCFLNHQSSGISWK